MASRRRRRKQLASRRPRSQFSAGLSSSRLRCRQRHVETPITARSARRANRGEGRAAARGERSGAQGSEGSLRELGTAAAPRREDARDDSTAHWSRRLRARRTRLLRDCNRRRRFPALHRRARAARIGLGVHRVARHAGQRREVGGTRGGEARCEVGRSRPLRPDSRSDESLAHDSRIDRPSDRARSRDGLRGELRRHELRRAAGEA